MNRLSTTKLINSSRLQSTSVLVVSLSEVVREIRIFTMQLLFLEATLFLATNKLLFLETALFSGSYKNRYLPVVGNRAISKNAFL
jgi:hypothetical protein